MGLASSALVLIYVVSIQLKFGGQGSCSVCVVRFGRIAKNKLIYFAIGTWPRPRPGCGRKIK